MPKKSDIKYIRKKMRKKLDSKRYEHTLGVAYTAMNLASLNNVDIRKAEIAGLLHDCAKCLDDELMLDICKKHNLVVTEIESRNPFLLHAKVGSFIAAHKYGIEDSDILNAILNHTTGRPEMSKLEKIIFIADYIEPTRKEIPGLAEARKLSFENIDKALVFILKNILNYLINKGDEIDPKTRITFEYYSNLMEDMNELN